MTPVVWSPDYFADLGKHVMPIRKFGLVAASIQSEGGVISPARRVTDAELTAVHTPEYVAAITTGEPRALAESQKFPWSAALGEAVRWTNGGTIEALRIAMAKGVCGNLASGFHHAHADHGEGFCTFNGLMVALEAVGPTRALVVDCDLHFGNGTASMLEAARARGRADWRHVSIYGNGYWQNAPIRDATAFVPPAYTQTTCVPVAPGTAGPDYVETVRHATDAAIQASRPEIILYQAGADPYREDPYSPLNVSLDDLAARDEAVFRLAHAAGIPVMWVLAGGYTEDITKVVAVHHNTWRAANAVFGQRAQA